MSEAEKPVVLEPWDRRQEESPEAYEAFCVYRDMGLARSQKKAAEHLGKTRQLLSGWSSRHDWTDRVAAWDLEQDRQRREAMRAENVAAGRRHAQQAQGFLQVAALFPLELLRRLQQDPEILKDLDLDTLVDYLTKLGRTVPRLIVAERLARGMSTENVEHAGHVTVHHERAERMTDDELDRFLLGEGAPQLPADPSSGD